MAPDRDVDSAAPPSWARRMPTFHAWLRGARRIARAAPAYAERASGLAIPLAVAACLWVAYEARFVQDDAYISFRYAKHLARGLGLVFNPGGPRVEGYTNFLFTVLVAAGLKLGASAEHAAYAIGLAAHAVTLAIVARSARALGASRAATVIAIAALALNPTFAAYATGGLETSLVTMLALLGVTAVISAPKDRDERAFATISLLFAIATLARPDAGVPVAAALAVMLVSRRATARELAALALPAAIILGAYAAWKLRYYGTLLPNPFHAKRIGSAPIAFGVRYVGAFLWSNGLAIALPLAALSARRRWSPQLSALVAAVAAILGFVAWAGGDFMEYRLLVPAMPPAAILFAATALRGARPLAIVASLALFGASLARFLGAPGFDLPRGVETIARLRAHVADPDVGWVRIGQVLGETFERDPSVVIAVRAAGAIPYASDLPAIDMLGLNDAWIARHGTPVRYPGLRDGYRPGHAVTATLDYLVRAGAVLVVAHPIVVPEASPDPIAQLAENPYFAALGFDRSASRVIVVPLGNGLAVLVWYLTPNARVDAIVARRGLRVLTGR